MTSVRERDLTKLAVGDTICDMHYGSAQLAECFTVVSHVQWPEWDVLSYASRSRLTALTFSQYLSDFIEVQTERMYHNKMLVVLGVEYHDGKPFVTAGYSYDARRNGVIVLTTLP